MNISTETTANNNYTTFLKLFHQIFQFQEALNCQIHPQWREQNYDWRTAVNAEFYGEILERDQSWKWWKKSKPISEWKEEEKFQLALEWIDILHFETADYLAKFPSFENFESGLLEQREELHLIFAKEIFDACEEPEDLQSLSKTYEFEELFPSESIFSQLSQLGFPPIAACQLYFAKNALNQFRQEQGSKDGSYQKVWKGGMEDNWHLQKMLEVLDLSGVHPTDLVEEIKAKLLLRYEHFNQ